MAITPAEKQDLLEYILGRMCREFRSGEPCCDGPPGNRVPRGAPHAACINAARVYDIANRA